MTLCSPPRAALLLALIVSLIGSTHSTAGLRVRSELDRRRYPGGVTISDAWFQRILGVVMIGTIITILLPQSEKRDEPTEADRKREKWIYPAMFAIGFYGGFIQVSVGFLFMAALYYLMRMNLVYVNMHKVTIVMIYMVPALAIYAFTGNVDWLLGLILGAGSAVGGWWAAHASVKGGEKIIRMALAVAIFIMALKLFEVF